MTTLRKQLRKYLILGSQDCQRPIESILNESIKAGITAFQFREKGSGALNGRKKYELAKHLQYICHQHRILFIVNDDVDLAMTIDADGIHLGQGDCDVKSVKQMNPRKIIGLSISNLVEYKNSSLDYVDYIGAGPIYSTHTKVDAKRAVGTGWLKQLKGMTDKPIVAIGGIKPNKAIEVLESGADGLCFISAVAHAENITEVIHAL